MKPFAFVVATVVLAAPLGAQLPSLGVAKPEAPGENVESGEARIGLASLSALRYSQLDGSGPAQATAGLNGFELFARTNGIGVYARSLTGAYTSGPDGLAGEFVYREARLELGSSALSLEPGVIRRTTSSLNDPKDETIWRAGFRSSWEIGASGVQVTLDAGARFADSPGDKSKFLGVDGSAVVLLQAPRGLPVYALAGWQYERFDDPWSASARTEELSGPMLGIGVRLAKLPYLR